MNLIHILHPLNAMQYSQPYEMYLAQEVLDKMTDAQSDLLRKRASYKILDNGCYELDASIDIPQILEAAKKINASEIILPDIMGNFNESIKRTFEALDKLLPLNRSDMKFMAVCQGESFEEYESCATMFSQIKEISCIGIPKKFGRAVCSNNIIAALARADFANNVALQCNKEVHMLGISWSPLELSHCADAVRTCDTNLIVENIKAGRFIKSPWNNEKYTLDTPLTDNQLLILENVAERLI